MASGRSRDSLWLHSWGVEKVEVQPETFIRTSRIEHV